MKNIFDIANGYNSPTRLCTQAELEGYLDSIFVRQDCEAAALAFTNWTPDTPHDELREMKDKAAQFKKNLPVLLPHAHFSDSKRHKESAEESPWVCCDFDGLINPEQIWEKYIKPKIEDIRIVLAFVSPSGRGIKIISQLPDGMTREEAQEWIGEEVGLEYDHTHDLARCCFLVGRDNLLYYKPEQLFAECVETFTAKKIEIPEVLPLNSQLSTLNYLGIPYSDIIDEWWKQHNGGKTPVVSNRDTLTFELAVNLRHICAFDRALMDKVIPNYDGFSEAEKLKCIDSALKEKRSRMPARLMTVLAALKAKNADNKEIVSALDEVEAEDENYYINQMDMDALPKSLIASFDGIKKTLWMPALIGVAPMVGALATGIQMAVHSEYSKLNLCVFVAGDSGSGKSCLDKLFLLWMDPILADDKVYHEQEQEYLDKLDRKKNSNLRPERPKLPIRIQSLRTSLSQVVKRMKNANGKHLFSYTPEADQLAQNNKSAWGNLSVLMRCLYDGSKFDTDYANGDSTGLYIDHVHWNMVLCGTPDALYRAVTNYTNGEANRLALAKVPDNTFAMLDTETKLRSEESEKQIKNVAKHLMLLQGDLDLDKVEETGREWLEKIRLAALKDDNRTYAGLRMRAIVTASRIICTHMLQIYVEYLLRRLDNNRGKLPKWAHGCKTAEEFLKMHPRAVEEHLKTFQTEGMMHNFEVIADYIIDQLYYYFGDRIEAAKSSPNYVSSKKVRIGKNDDVYAKLPEEFTYNDAKVIKGVGASANSVKQMLKNWKSYGLIRAVGYCKYRKQC